MEGVLEIVALVADGKSSIESTRKKKVDPAIIILLCSQ